MIRLYLLTRCLVVSLTFIIFAKQNQKEMKKLFYVDACLREGSNTKKIASSDRLVIEAPFWDMSFPSALKVFFENMSLFNVTFANDEKCLKLCDVF